MSVATTFRSNELTDRSEVDMSQLQINSADEADAIDAEVALQLRACVPMLTPFQAMLVQEQLDMEPSRLYARLCAYVRLVQEVEAYATANAEKKPSAAEHDTDDVSASPQPAGTPTNAATTAGAGAAPAAAADSGIAHGSAAAAILEAPVLSHPTFFAALQDHLLRLLEERWETCFAVGGANGSSVSCNDGKRISKAERAKKGLNKSSLVYGEVAFHTLGEVLWGPHCIHSLPAEGGTFVDLGSGTGRGVLAAAGLWPFARLVGVEILEGLHQAAVEVANYYERNVRPTFGTASSLPPPPPPPAPVVAEDAAVEREEAEEIGGAKIVLLGDPRASAKIELMCGSFLELDWPSAADVVFANSTCFDDELMDAIATQGQGLRDGALVITLTRALNSPYFKLVYSEQHTMSWGSATINIAVKRTPEPEEIQQALKLQQALKAKQRIRHTDLD